MQGIEARHGDQFSIVKFVAFFMGGVPRGEALL